MVQNNNEHEKIPEEGKNLNSSEMDKLKNDLEKEENEAIGSSKYARTDLLHELESHESQKDSREAQSYFNHAESREGDK